MGEGRDVRDEGKGGECLGKPWAGLRLNCSVLLFRSFSRGFLMFE